MTPSGDGSSSCSPTVSAARGSSRRRSAPSSASASRRRPGTCGCCARPASSTRSRTGGPALRGPPRGARRDRGLGAPRPPVLGRAPRRARDRDRPRAEEHEMTTDVWGVLTPTTTGTTVRFERRYATTPEDLWSAVTEPERVARWLGPVYGDLGAAAGTSCGWATTSPARRRTRSARSLECDPPRRLVDRLGVPRGGSEPRVARRHPRRTGRRGPRARAPRPGGGRGARVRRRLARVARPARRPPGRPPGPGVAGRCSTAALPRYREA